MMKNLLIIISVLCLWKVNAQDIQFMNWDKFAQKIQIPCTCSYVSTIPKKIVKWEIEDIGDWSLPEISGDGCDVWSLKISNLGLRYPSGVECMSNISAISFGYGTVLFGGYTLNDLKWLYRKKRYWFDVKPTANNFVRGLRYEQICWLSSSWDDPNFIWHYEHPLIIYWTGSYWDYKSMNTLLKLADKQNANVKFTVDSRCNGLPRVDTSKLFLFKNKALLKNEKWPDRAHFRS